MSTQKALFLESKQGALVLKTVNVPEPNPGELLVKVEASALNPLDWKIAVYGSFIDTFPAILGSDIAGTVAGLGAGALGFAIGDRVVFQGKIGDNAYSGFQQYALADAELTVKLPSNVSLDDAASIPAGLLTAGSGLYAERHSRGGVGLTPPWEGGRGQYAGKPIVVFGGSSSIGQYVLQLARLSGFGPIIATASLHNATLLKSLGATHVLDRHLSADALRAEIAKITSAPVETVYDAVSFPDTQLAAHRVLAPGGTLAIVLDDVIPKEERSSDKTVVFTFGYVHTPLNRAWSIEFVNVLPGLLEEKAIVPNRVEILPGGLAGIQGGLDRLRKDEVSGKKLVVRPQETQ
ncbi:chaperonin 10-like protein [Amylocystis lapponica]|nr:chaperonin 10-like protein [Amylocystis lapponica]